MKDAGFAPPLPGSGVPWFYPSTNDVLRGLEMTGTVNLPSRASSNRPMLSAGSLRPWSLFWVFALSTTMLGGCRLSPRRAGFLGPRIPDVNVNVGPQETASSSLSNEPDEALGQVDQWFRNNGYNLVGSAVRNPNMPRNGIMAYAIDASSSACYVAVALGSPGQSLNLTALNQRGQTVGADVSGTHHSKVALCGQQGRLSVRLQMLQGEGEYYYAVYQGAGGQAPNMASLFGGSGSGTGQTQRATLDATTQSRISAVEQQLGSNGYRRITDNVYGEVLGAQDARQFDLNLQQGTCYAFATFAGPGVSDTDVFVQDTTGNALASERSGNADAVVQDFCPQETGRYTLRTLLYAGAGPVFTVGYVRTQGTTETDPNAIASESTAGAGLDQNFRLLDADMRARGYESYGSNSNGELNQGSEQAFSLEFEGGKCYAILGVGDNGVRDLDLVLASGNQEVDRDIETDARPIVRVCPERSGTYQVKVRMHAGQGRFIYAPYRWPRGTRGPFGLSGLIYVRLAEVTSLLAVDGYEPDVDIAPGQGQTRDNTRRGTHRIRLQANRCYSILTVGGDGVTDVNVELKLGNASLVRDQTTNAFPSVRHCATRTGNYTLSVQTANAAGKYFYQVFQRTDS